MKENPKFLKWVFSDKRHTITYVLATLGLIGSIFTAIAMKDEPIVNFILAMFPIVGFTIGMYLQPYLIYRKLIKINFFKKNETDDN